ncbi:MAG TPA: acyltransferase family protein [Stackebrandtia sp.]|jgi:fucose 4-O-acetylase-like acetyltransferase|uniref:acyltransferase family protein n=1 Tax=Stackebrandtia sp. TaxID=2023065 RepID=UPI002D361E40|nr:acyltransferase family protein [Stackebrandtia sp.]HZE37538.1 acyltransferase family protein [Stackebrandtia sp.]
MSTEVLDRTPDQTSGGIGTPDKPREESKKDSYFSNAKLILILLVVTGHTWSPMADYSSTIRSLYLVLYDLHMPAFILLCGYFSRNFAGKPRQLHRLVTSVAAPYLIFSLLYGVFRWWTDGEPDPSLLSPYYLLWFLSALFIWRITSPIWTMVRFPVLVAIVISVGAATMTLPSELDLGRILQFLPFFVAGMFMKREYFERLRHPFVRIVGPIACLGIWYMAFKHGGSVNLNWVYYTDGAGQMDSDLAHVLPMKAIILGSAAVLLATFFAYVPERTFWFTRLGELTMFVYLLHGFFTKGAELGLHLYDYAFLHTPWGEATLTLGALALGCLLLTPPVRWLTRPLVEPKLNWLMKPLPPRKRATESV